MFGLVGVTVREINMAGITATVVEPKILPDVAVIVVEPTPMAAASPLLPAALLIVATLVFEEFHVTDVVMSRELLSE
jgi:hypothetical protein